MWQNEQSRYKPACPPQQRPTHHTLYWPTRPYRKARTATWEPAEERHVPANTSFIQWSYRDLGILSTILLQTTIAESFIKMKKQYDITFSLSWSLIMLKGLVHQKKENSVINYSPSCRSKPIRPLFIFRHKLKYLWWNPKAFWPSIDSNITTTVKARKDSKDIVKICPWDYSSQIS